MGTIIIKVPQEIQVECEINDAKSASILLETVKNMEKIPEATDYDTLTGLFADEVELIDQITEWAMQAREKDSLRRSSG